MGLTFFVQELAKIKLFLSGGTGFEVHSKMEELDGKPLNTLGRLTKEVKKEII